MFQGERVKLRALEIENANQAVLHEQRHDQLGTSFQASAAANVTRVARDVIDAQDTPLARSRSGESLVQRDAQARGNRITAAHGENALQMLGLLVPQHDAEDVILDDFLDAFGDAAKELLAVKDGSDFAADFVKQGEGIGLVRVRKDHALRDGVRVTQQGKGADFREVFDHGRGAPPVLYLM